MSNYTDKEYSVAEGSPYEAYRFIGSVKNYYYTSAETDITISGQVYSSVNPIRRSAISITGHQEDCPDLEIEVPYDLELVQDYGYGVPPSGLRLELLRYHEGTDPSTDYVVIWKGVVGPISISGHMAKIVVPNIFSLMLRGEIPSVYYHPPCNHVLYDSRCGMVSTDFDQATTVVTVTAEDTIEVDDDGFADEYLRGGEIVNDATGERRLIVDNVANVITLNFPFQSIAVDDAVTLYAGCNHSFAMCKARFDNAINYGGYPFIPEDNPFESEL